MKHAGSGTRQLPEMRSVQVVQTLSAASDQRRKRGLAPVPGRAAVQRAGRARGQSASMTAHPGAGRPLGGSPDFVRGPGPGPSGSAGFRAALADAEGGHRGGTARSARAMRGPASAFESRRSRSPNCPPAPRGGRRDPLHPLTEATRHLVTRSSCCPDEGRRPCSWNVARGPVVDTKALLRRTGERALSSLDVTTSGTAVRPGHPLWHCSGIVNRARTAERPTSASCRARSGCCDQLNRFVNREPLRNVILKTGLNPFPGTLRNPPDAVGDCAAHRSRRGWTCSDCEGATGGCTPMDERPERGAAAGDAWRTTTTARRRVSNGITAAITVRAPAPAGGPAARRWHVQTPARARDAGAVRRREAP
ncbi:hypothetical protein FQR65_LT20173 [Abscondita terminalis]|nr:hypothetical protein FQR65_LT20173 [Abscondita terminalis]